MKKAFDYRNSHQRKNIIKNTILGFFDSIASYPRMVLEVFFRTDMGERNFTLISAITVGFTLFFLPFYNPFTRGYSILTTLWIYWSWYVFLACYSFFSFKRYLEIRRNPGVFDLEKYSLSRGGANPLFLRFYKRFKIEYNPRLQEIVIEPMTAVAAGLLLFLFGQTPLAALMVFCAIVYSGSMWYAYWRADQWVMDQLDNLICSKEYEGSFRSGNAPGKGLIHPKLPTIQAIRDEVIEFIQEEDETYVR